MNVEEKKQMRYFSNQLYKYKWIRYFFLKYICSVILNAHSIILNLR